MQPLVLIVIALLLLKVFTQVLLEAINRRHTLAAKGPVPEAFQGMIDQAAYEKSIAYTIAKSRFAVSELVFDSMLLLVVVLSGFLPWFYYGLTARLGEGVWGQGAVLLLITFVLALPSLPWGWWNQFRLEERFGFNKSTLKLWMTDKLKGAILGCVIGYPLICALLYFFRQFPDTWWAWGFVLFFGFQVLMLLLYPRLILPLFNKLSPLEAGALRDRLMALAERTGFAASNIEVMDGSKRSGHSNAFFTGFGKFRHIVLFDTLIEQLKEVELEAVLAHEIGHYKKGHVPKMLILSAVMSLVGFACVGWLTKAPSFYSTFGFSIESGIVPALILFSLLIGIVTFWMGPAMSAWSRKHEYEADAFAKAAMGEDADPLVRSLRKLHTKNLSNLTPHPLYSRFYYSHPTLLEREAALKAE